jgi:hypothetical protein
MYFALIGLSVQLEKCLKALPDKSSPEIQYALKVKSALVTGNYVQIFRLRQRGPFMTAYLLDIFAPRLRKAAVASMCQAYLPAVPLGYVRKALDFVTEAECVDYLKTLGCVVDEDTLRSKESLEGLREAGVLVGASTR